jgi:hypothetical protein
MTEPEYCEAQRGGSIALMKTIPSWTKLTRNVYATVVLTFMVRWCAY